MQMKMLNQLSIKLLFLLSFSCLSFSSFSQCELSNFSLDASACDGGQFTLTVNFDFVDNEDDNFILTVYDGVNDTLLSESFAYTDLPIEVLIEDEVSSGFNVVAVDETNEMCAIDGGVDNPCFNQSGDCEIGTIETEILTCEDGEFDVSIDFEYANVTNTFTIVGNGFSYGTFEYINLPIILSGLDADCSTSYEFIITDEIDGDCSNFTGIGTVCCDDECDITNLNVEVGNCIDDEFSIEVSFDYVSPSSSFTYIVVNDLAVTVQEGVYFYADLPLILGLGNDGTGVFLMIIEDTEGPFPCGAEAEFDNPCSDGGDCAITAIDYDEIPICEDGFVVADWFIFSENSSEFGYDIFINNEFITFVEYNSSNLYDFNFENPGTEYFTIQACDNDNPDCCFTTEYLNPCYEESGDCFIGEISVEQSDCNSDGFFSLELNFEYENTSDQFTLGGNGINYGTYSYADLPITLEELEGDCLTEYEFVVTDLNNNNCTTFIEWGVVCCDEVECEIGALVIETSECNDG